MAKGTVKWYSSQKGYGFIATEDIKGDVFVHESQIEGYEGCKSLREGDEVIFKIRKDSKGPKAKDVLITNYVPRINYKKVFGKNPTKW